MAYKIIDKKPAQISLLTLSSMFMFVVLFAPIVSLIPTPAVVHAQGNEDKDYTLLEPLPCLTGKEANCQNGEIKKIDLGNAIQYAFNLFMAVAAVAAIFMMTYGGFKYMTTDSWYEKKDGRKNIENALIGLLMVLGAFLIMRTVNPKLVDITAAIPAIKVDRKSAATQNFFDNLNKEADTYRINNQAAIQERAAAREREVDLVTQKSEIQTKILEATETNDEAQLKTLNQQIVALDDKISRNRSTIITSQAISLFNGTMTTLTGNETTSGLGSGSNILDPEGAKLARESGLTVIEKAAKNINTVQKSAVKNLVAMTNSDTPTRVQEIIQNGDDALLKTADIYVNTYKTNPPVGKKETQDTILRMIKFKNSLEITDPAKKEQGERMIVDLCKKEIVKVGSDPNLCK